MDWREILIGKLLQIGKTIRIGKLLRFKTVTYPFTDYFHGFEKVKAIRRLFGERTEDVLSSLKVEFTWIGGYMRVNNEGHLVVNLRYLKNGDRVDIYLDIIHELVHIKQFMEGKQLFDSKYSYIERPTEIEAYRYVVKEARRVGLNDERICEHLKVEWISYDSFKQLAKTLNVNCK
ncbi:hypothetical protein KAS14_06765 [Candidatus Bathyarchaeota archaeon]|nr:hypothetical protein [Candidatus Bathyarchaeota archaeon]